MKRLAFLLLLTLPIAARADDASRHAKAQQMVNLLHLDKLLAQVMDSVTKQTSAMTRQMAGDNITPDMQVKLDAFQKKVFALIDTQLGWKAMEPTYVDLYAKAYTDDELDAILAFYRSPAGAAVIAKTPELTTQSQQIAVERMQALQPQMAKLLEDFTKDISTGKARP